MCALLNPSIARRLWTGSIANVDTRLFILPAAADFATVCGTVGQGMDLLKKALGDLEAPICPNCHLNMRWFRSELVRDTPPAIIAHLFVCPNCKRAQRTDTKLTSPPVPPDKLAAPRFRVIAGGK